MAIVIFLAHGKVPPDMDKLVFKMPTLAALWHGVEAVDDEISKELRATHPTLGAWKMRPKKAYDTEYAKRRRAWIALAKKLPAIDMMSDVWLLLPETKKRKKS